VSSSDTARRLARRYLPERVRRAVIRLRQPTAGAGGRRPQGRAAAPAPAPPASGLVRSLERGRRLDHAIVAEARALIRAQQHHRAESIAESLRRQADTAALGHLVGGIVAFRRGFVERAREQFRSVPRELWLRLAPAEYVRSGLAVDREATLQELRALAADDPPEVRAKPWFDMLAPVHGLGEAELARALFAIFDRHVREDPRPWRDAAMHRDWMAPWVAADPDAPSAPSPAGGRRTFAILDYGHPGRKRGSANIGDHVQSIAAMGHLVRHTGVRLHGPEDLVGLLGVLAGRVRPERERRDLGVDLEVRTVHRDASAYEAIPEGTWVLCFGWFMHALFSIRHGFPLHRNLRPIFISFHCNKRDLLTPEAIEYLKRYGPVGCRDWTTVYLLLSIGVPAFFSGCLTTTIDTVFPDLATPPAADAPVAYVDVPPEDVPADGVAYKHSSDAVRVRPFTANARDALERLDTYRSRHRAVVTSRLHCYLPLRSIGAEVEFRPKNRADIRFDGLDGIDDRAFATMRDGLLDKLEQVFTGILSGRSEAEVYALWREITASDVAEAERRRHLEARIGPAADVVADLRRRVAATTTAGPAADDAVHCAVLPAAADEATLGVLAASLLDHATRPLHLWLPAPRDASATAERLADRFPQVTVSSVPTDGLEPDLMPLRLAGLLPAVDRAIVLPATAVATGDIAELAGIDLGGHALAAPTRPGRVDVSGFGLIHAAAARLPHRTEAAAALRRTAHARHRFDFDAFSTDVLVLDLERLRQDALLEQALPLVAEYGLSGPEVLHYLVGPERAVVPERWARVPTRMPERGPGLLHWADAVKPWQPELTPGRERWRHYA
jgi:hypothetical protein